MGLKLNYPVKLPQEEVLTDVPSSQTVVVRYGPSEGMSPVVCITESAAEEFPRELREQFVDYFETHLPQQADELMDGSTYHGSKYQRALAMIKFAPGTPPHVALQLTRQLVNWFFQDLAPRAYRRIQRCMKQVRRQQKRQEQRNEGRNQCRRALWAR